MKPFQTKFSVGGKEYYTLRIGQQAPPNAVNLSYIYNTELRPDENIQILGSAASDIITDSQDNSMILWSDENGYLYEDIGTEDVVLGDPGLHSDAFALSAVFNKTSGDVTIDDAYMYKYFLAHYYIDSDGMDGVSGPPFEDRDPLIEVLNENGTPLSDKLKYKIFLDKKFDLYRKTPTSNILTGRSAYVVTIYSNFTSDSSSTYIVRYNKVDTYEDEAKNYASSQENNYTETFNAISQMVRKNINDVLAEPYYDPTNTYTVEHNSSGYKIKVHETHKAEPDTRVRQKFWWKLAYNNKETDWQYNEVVDENNTSGSPAKKLSENNLVDIMKLYDKDFTASGNATLYIGLTKNADNVITNISNVANPRAGETELKPVGTDLCFYFDDDDYIVAYTSNPDTTSQSATGIEQVVTKPILADVTLESKLFNQWRPVNWSTTVSGTQITIPSGGFDNKWSGFKSYIYNTGSSSGGFNIYTMRSTWTSYTAYDNVNYAGNWYFEGMFLNGWISKMTIYGNSYAGTVTNARQQSHLITYYWVPRNITVTNYYYNDDLDTYVYLNDQCILALGRDGSATVTMTFVAGWNKMQVSLYHTHVDGDTMWFYSYYNHSYLLQSALGSSGRVYQNSYPTSQSTWTKVLSGTTEVSTNPDGTKNNATVGPINWKTNPPAGVELALQWGGNINISPSTGIQLVGSPTVSGDYLSFTFTMSDYGYWSDIGKTTKTLTVTSGIESDEAPKVVCDLKEMQDEIGVTFPTGSREANNHVLVLSCNDYRVNTRFKYSDEYLFDSSSDIIETITPTSNKSWVLYKNLPTDLSTVDVVGWTNGASETFISKPFGLKINTSRTFFLEIPQEIDDKNNWYLKVHNASVTKAMNLPSDPTIMKELVNIYPGLEGNEGEEVWVEYSLPEFDRQYFINKPIVEVNNEEAEKIDEYTIKVRNTPICHYRPIRVDGHTVRDIQAIQGIIKFNEPFAESLKQIYVDYSYLEEWVKYRGYYDGRTPYDSGVQGTTFWHLDINPAPQHDHITTEVGIPGHRSLNSMYDPNNPELSDSEKEGVTRVRKATNMMLSRPIYVYIYPRSITLADKKVKNKLGEESASTTIFHTTMVDIFKDPFAILLGKIYIQPNSSLRDIEIVDSRTRGGGLSEIVSQAVIDQINQESNYYWDIGYWDGQPYQENGVVFIRLPESLLLEFGGRFTREEVKENIKKYLSLGVLPQIEYISHEEFLSEYVTLPDSPEIEITGNENDVDINITEVDIAQFYRITRTNTATGDATEWDTEVLHTTDSITMNGNEYEYSVVAAVWIDSNKTEYISSFPTTAILQR